MRMNSKLLREHKLRQKIYLTFNKEERVNKNKTLLIKSEPSEQLPEDLEEDIFDYFLVAQEKLIYPAKSFAVAIVYAKLLEKYFGIPALESLNDPELFQNTDRFYKTLDECPGVYERSLKRLEERELLDFEASALDQVRTTVSCFHEEFYTAHNSLDTIRPI